MSAQHSAGCPMYRPPNHPVNYPGNSRVLFGQRPGNGRVASEPMLTNGRHDVRNRIQSMTSPQSVRNRDRSRIASAQRPQNHGGNHQTTSTQCPSSCRETSPAAPAMSAQRLAQQPGSVRGIATEVHEAVHLADVQRPVGVQLIDRTASDESSARFPRQ